MEIKGRIIAVLPIQTGEGKNGTWRSQDYVLETGDQYPKKVCFNLFGDKIEQFPISIDMQVNVSFDIESREYNGRWFTSVKAWKVDNVGGASTVQNATATEPQPIAPNEGTDLPF